MEAPEEVFPPIGALIPDTTVLDSLSDHDGRLIMDLVSNIRPAAEVLKAYGITPSEFAAKAKNEMFASAYREAQKLWKSDMNINQRIRLKAAYCLEDSIPNLYKIVTAQGIGVNAKLEAIEKLIKISTVSNVPKEGAQREMHNITINIGGDKPPIKIVAESHNERAVLTTGP